MLERHEVKIETRLKTRDLGNGIWEILPPPGIFHCYMIMGSESALLIDTGMGVGPLRKTVEQIAGKPVQVLLTHGHPDHGGGLAEFASCYLHKADIELARKMTSLSFRQSDLGHILRDRAPELMMELQPTPDTVFVSPPEILDLGGRSLQILHTPGHTDGSVSVYDANTGSLFAGDTVQPRIAFQPDGKTTVCEMRDALIPASMLDVQRILCGHDMPVSVHDGRTLLDHVIAALTDIAEGRLQGNPGRGRDGNPTVHYESRGVSVDTRPENGKLQ